MGNESSTTKNPNVGWIQLEISDYTLQSLPNKPENLKNRIADNMWSEFTTISSDSCKLPDIADRKKVIQTSNTIFGLSFVFGVMGGGVLAGVGGGILGQQERYGAMAVCVIFGALLFGLGLYGFVWINDKTTETLEKFINDVRDLLNDNVNELNQKYDGIIYFKVRSVDNTANPFLIFVDIEIKVKGVVEAIENENVMPMQMEYGAIQPMVIAQPEELPHVVTIQMPDGRMVEAQIMGQVQQIYNPSANGVEEQQVEGGATNHGNEYYQ